jgi:hypothetical protein
VTAILVADRPRAADIARNGRQTVVLALPETVADGMDRRQIHDIETHRPDLAQTTDAVLQGAMPVRHIGLRARKELVPRGKAGDWPIDHDRQRWRQFVALAAIGVAGHHAAHHTADSQVYSALLLAGSECALDRGDDAVHAYAILALRDGRRPFEDYQPLQQFTGKVGTRYVLFADFVGP